MPRIDTWRRLNVEGSLQSRYLVSFLSREEHPKGASGLAVDVHYVQHAASEPSSKKFYVKLKSPSMASAEDLFQFAKIPLGDFEGCLAFMEGHTAIDYRASAEKMLWQTYKTFERLLKRDFEDRHLYRVQDFANQCVQQYALLDYGADCGYENLRKYLHNLVLTSEWYRTDYLTRMMNLPPPARLEFIQRPVPGHLEKLKWFCLLYDHLYEKIEQEARHRTDKTLLDKFQTRLENVQARLSRGANTTLNSPDADIGRAI